MQGGMQQSRKKRGGSYQNFSICQPHIGLHATLSFAFFRDYNKSIWTTRSATFGQLSCTGQLATTTSCHQRLAAIIENCFCIDRGPTLGSLLQLAGPILPIDTISHISIVRVTSWYPQDVQHKTTTILYLPQQLSQVSPLTSVHQSVWEVVTRTSPFCTCCHNTLLE